MSSTIIQYNGRTLVPGDANGDTKINSLDLVSIINQILNVATATGNPDCNGDHNVNSLDLVCVINTILTTR